MQSEQHHRQLWTAKTEAAAQLNEASAAQAVLQQQRMHAQERLAAAEARLQEERSTMQRQLAKVLSEKEATVQKLHQHLGEVCVCQVL
jgi:ParB-like chromosome segregation protein Spo0J